MAQRVRPNMGCGYTVMLILLAAGLGLLVLAAGNYRQAGAVTAKAVAPGIIGLALVVGAGAYRQVARRLVRESEEEAARRLQAPGEPWKWKKEWLNGIIEAKDGTNTALLWLFTLFWNAIALPALWAVLTKPQRDPGVYFVFLFPLVGLGLLAGAVYKTIQGRKYGRPRFLLSRLPGEVGGYVGGMIEVPARVTPGADVRLVLRCIRRQVQGSGKNRSVRETVLWEHEERLAPARVVSSPSRTELPVLFYVPDTCAPTDDADPDNEVLWRVTAAAPTPGVDFAATFNVPVFRTGETAAPPEPGRPVLEDYRSGPPDAAMLAEAGVRREPGGYHFGDSHLTGARLVFTAIAAGFVALWVVLWGRDAHWIVWTVSGLFGAFFLYGAQDLWQARFELLIGPDEVVVRRPRPWGVKETRVPRKEVAGIQPDKSMAIGTTQYYRLALTGAEGAGPAQPAGAGESFAGRELRYLAEQAAKTSVTPADPETAARLERLRHPPKFTVVFAKHIPGQTMAENLAALILGEIRGGK
jgi:hypothetical protein